VVVGPLRQLQSAPSRTPRRLGDSRFHLRRLAFCALLAVAIGIVLLSVADAFLTLALLQGGPTR
jgi:hypothetical protein